jgi:hypothetical protein
VSLGALVITDDEMDLAVSLVVTSVTLAGGKFWITSELLNPQELPTANRGHRLIGPDGIPVMTWTGKIGWPGVGENGEPLRAVYVTQDVIITGEGVPATGTDSPPVFEVGPSYRRPR